MFELECGPPIDMITDLGKHDPNKWTHAKNLKNVHTRQILRQHVFIGGATGDIILNENGDRSPDFWLFNMQDDETYHIVTESVSTRLAGGHVNRVRVH